MAQKNDGRRPLKHVKDESPFHLFELDIVDPSTTWKKKVFSIVQKEKLLNNPSLIVLEKILKSHERYHIWMHPKDVDGDKHENYEEKNVSKVTQWELMFEIKNVEKKVEYAGYPFYDETEEQIEIDLSIGSLEEIEVILNKISLKLPELN